MSRNIMLKFIIQSVVYIIESVFEIIDCDQHCVRHKTFRCVKKVH